MSTSIKTIKLNEESFDVALLHQVLAALGVTVVEEERAAATAGEDTRQKVLALKKQLHVDVQGDGSQVVDKATAAALEGALKNQGLTAAGRAFTVSGTVRKLDGSIAPRQSLVAFDLDLRGVGVYTSAETVAELKRSGGCEILGVTASDAQGRYKLTFYDWQYRRAERQKADVVVFAIDRTTAEGRIMGRSRMAHSGDYSAQGLIVDFDVILTGASARTEYDTVMPLLERFLKESEVRLDEIAKSPEQVSFTADELEIGRDSVEVAATAAALAHGVRGLSHELLYAIGRQSIVLHWSVLGSKTDDELRAAIAASAKERIVGAADDGAIKSFLAALHEHTAKAALDDGQSGDPNSLKTMLSNALPDSAQQVSFVGALATFNGTDYTDFWTKHLPGQPEFKGKPELVKSVLLTSQLTALTGNHQALVGELMKKKISSMDQLLDLETSDWLDIVKKTGVPAGIEGADDLAKQQRYAERLKATLDATFPTQRIARMVQGKHLPLPDQVAGQVAEFLAKTPAFDFSTSRVFDFEKELAAAAGENAPAVKDQLLRLQRVFQVSTTPDAMATLFADKLHSAYAIANIPRKTFLQTYSGKLGGTETAFAVHERASHIATKSEMAAVHIWEYGKSQIPQLVFGWDDRPRVQSALQKQVPDYATLFGSPDLCECEECNSVYGAAAYLVDLLRFLWRGEPNADGKTPLDILAGRRPDLLHLPLTCENTNTIIPYIDLANEVMEYYTTNDSIAAYEGHDTGDATAEELRANPQNFDLEAYRKLKDAKYPFTLPYHQPLGVIRTYSDYLEVSRYETMKAVTPAPAAAAAQAIAAEALRVSQEGHLVITGTSFDGSADATALYQYYGLAASGDLDNLSAVREFLARTGVAYTDLVELVKTLFINPARWTLDFLEQFASYVTIDASTLYNRLQQVKAGMLDPAADADLAGALTAYNADHGTALTPAQFATWIGAHFDEFDHVITLYEPESACDLDNTKLRTIHSLYAGSASSGLTSDDWSRFHRFIRLWRKLGWTIHDLDLMLAALGQSDIGADTIAKLESVLNLQRATRLPLNQLAVFWGDIDSYGKDSLYRKLFLNKAVQKIDTAFQADAWGNYLQNSTEVLANHRSAILAAFHLSDDDLDAILGVAQLIDAATPRLLDPATDLLNLQNLGTIYRYAALAKGLKLRASELAKLVSLFGATPFSRWDIQQGKFVDVDPAATEDFYTLAKATKDMRFKSAVLEYIFEGTLPADSTLGLNLDKALATTREVRVAFSAIELAHPDQPPSPLAADVLSAKLSLTFQDDLVERFLAILDNTAPFETKTDMNLAVVIPDTLASKYTYTKGSGRLTVTGVVTDSERTALKALPGANANFGTAVDALYAAPEKLIADNFDGVFADLAEANATLLDHPAQATPATPEEKLDYVYTHFVPVLKAKLRKDAITQHIAALVRLSEAATTVLIAADIDNLITKLSTEGFSATYYSDPAWTTPVVTTTDPEIDFDWAGAAPYPSVPAIGFSARWEARVAPPASGEYTLVVEVAEADETFQLYLDDVLILEKTAADAMTSLEVVASLNAAKMHRVRLDYSNTANSAKIRLSWKTATTALEVVPAATAYPAAVIDDFVASATVYHRAAKFITGFTLSETELAHLIAFPADFGGIDFKALSAADWRRIYDYTSLRNAVPQAQAFLTDIFAAANTTAPAPTVDALQALLVKATAWDAANVAYLVGTHFALGVDAFKNEIALNNVRAVIEVATRTGLSAEAVAQWGAPETDFDKLHETAQTIKNAVKAKYEYEDWLDLAGRLSDTIRAQQQSALVAYLLTRPAIQAWGAEDADALFEFFLIDVQMGACMDTSRIVQANASVQMFVNRCLLNLESDRTSGSEKGVSPDAIDKDRWEWMSAYRVWEANRMVMLYPENDLEPEWRKDKSELFTGLESYVVQNDITDRSVETAFRDYLAGLNELANLEVCGMCKETYADGKLKYMHVFGRTHNSPYKFYYRTWNEYRKWSAWSEVPVDIRVVENGDLSGAHVIPVVWKKRLFLFWAEFLTKHEQPTSDTSKSVSDASDQPMSSLTPLEYWEIKLAWSEYVDGKWSPKQVSKEFVRQYHSWYLPGECATRFATEFGSNNELDIYFLIETIKPREWYQTGRFELADIASKVEASTANWGKAHETWDQRYSTFFMNVATWDKLELFGDTYLEASTNHKLLLTPETANYDPAFDDPFFFRDPYRTYFVRPVDVPIYGYLKDPTRYKPYLPGLASQNYYRQQPKYGGPQIGPGDPGPMRGDPAVGGVIAPTPPLAATARGIGAATAPMMSRTVASGSASSAAATAAVRAGAPATRSSANTEVALTTLLSNYSEGQALVSSSFGGNLLEKYGDKIVDWGIALLYKMGLEFDTFYHPHSSDYVTNLNQGGVSRLLESDTSIASDNGATFEDTYHPNFTGGLVLKPSDFADHTYYKEDVSFDVYGANSLYNWELFFHAPLYIATRLSRNGRYQEAMKWFHYIFDPTTDELPLVGQSEVSRYWKVLPFKTTPADSLEDWFRSLGPNGNPDVENAIVAEWRDNPFDPHLIASNRPLAYMKHVVLKYVENLVAWGDSLFRQDTMESVNEALQLYVLAGHILGQKPEFVPRRGLFKAESYSSLENKWDDFSNALVALENIFPYSSEANVSGTSTGTSLLGVGSALYFAIPPNDKLMGYWDTVADRLYKIRHCQNLDGVERKLALFAPRIEPGALIQALSQGLSLGSILADLSSPPPIHRFQFLIQRADAFCSDVRALGSALLAALEKRDAEELARLRASQETQMLTLMTGIKERQVLDAKAYKQQLDKSRDRAGFRMHYYADLLGSTVALPDEPSLAATLTADSTLPDTSIASLATDVDTSLVDSSDAGVKLIPREKEELDKNNSAMISHQVAAGMEGLGGILNFIPNFGGRYQPLGVGGTISYGGSNVGAGVSGLAKVPAIVGNVFLYEANVAAKMGGYIRREQEWTFQANLAAKEIIQLDKQIASAEIRIQVAETELDNHKQQIENAKAVEKQLQDKFTNQELYQWLKEQLFAVYKQAYDLAYDMAKKAEKAYKYEIGAELASFIQYGYWDNSKQGLVAGDKLQLALRQLEKSYLDEDRRELELVKNISLARLDPLALIMLRQTGRCYVSVPEELFDLDFRGHYFRRIKSVRLSIPCVVGPHTSISCSLHLLDNSLRIDTSMNSSGTYEHENDEGTPSDDARFRTIRAPVTAIATSQAQADSGLFELNFHDERYLPFEGAGAISKWEIELSTEKELRQFDYSTISDVILHLGYTAREAGGLFRDKATTYIKDFLVNAADLSDEPLLQMFSMKHDFSTEWYKFLHPSTVGGEQVLEFTLGAQRFPFFVQGRNAVLDKIDLFIESTQATTYSALLSYVNHDGDTVTSTEFSAPQSSTYEGLAKATLGVNDAGLSLDELDIAAKMTLKIKRSTASDYTALVTTPTDELKEVMLVLHYRLE